VPRGQPVDLAADPPGGGVSRSPPGTAVTAVATRGQTEVHGQRRPESMAKK